MRGRSLTQDPWHGSEISRSGVSARIPAMQKFHGLDVVKTRKFSRQKRKSETTAESVTRDTPSHSAWSESRDRVPSVIKKESTTDPRGPRGRRGRQTTLRERPSSYSRTTVVTFCERPSSHNLRTTVMRRPHLSPTDDGRPRSEAERVGRRAHLIP